jgi:hypothetical protein
VVEMYGDGGGLRACASLFCPESSRFRCPYTPHTPCDGLRYATTAGGPFENPARKAWNRVIWAHDHSMSSR